PCHVEFRLEKCLPVFTDNTLRQRLVRQPALVLLKCKAAAGGKLPQALDVARRIEDVAGMPPCHRLVVGPVFAQTVSRSPDPKSKIQNPKSHYVLTHSADFVSSTSDFKCSS